MKTIILFFIILAINVNLNAKVVYQDPVKDAKYVSINSNIIIGFDEFIRSTDLNSLIEVKGSVSGIHSGEVILTADKKKLIFKPHQQFSLNETVEVKLRHLKTSGTSNNNLRYYFQTQINKPEFDYVKFMEEDNTYTSAKNYVYADYPVILPALNVTVSNNPTPGRIYMNNFRVTAYPPHLIIANNDGSPFYYREMIDVVVDFKKLPDGRLTYFNNIGQKYYAEDANYNITDSFYCGNGYTTDFHDLQVLDNGHALLMSYDPQTVDMSLLVPGGNPNATVVGLIIQEIDENKNVVFQWRSWDHYNILDAANVDLTSAMFGYVHGNALEYDYDGNILVSARVLSEITKIDRSTGAMIWRLGGVNNQFTFPNDSISISYQHDIRRIANGNITFYDNGNFRPVRFSRAVEYQLDEVNKIATLVWQYRASPDRYAPTRGSVQRLSNGNTFICWGTATPNFTEVTQAGTVIHEMSFPNGVYSYRGYKEELSKNLNLTIAIEGFYDSSAGISNIRDTVTAYLRSTVSPFSIVDSARAVIDSVSLIGNFNFYNSYTGIYYISLSHRNALETWSRSGGESLVNGTIQNYNMTDLSSKAYGNNIVQVDNSPVKFALYSGDVIKDSFIDLNDVIYISNDASSFVSGYTISDLTGNNITDLRDILIAYNNAGNVVSVMRP